ncbi:hypothetical protein GCM10010972_10610 [Cellulomonas carbonis]|nr:hypothetical protein GCM10010972_10610 [Cellulomonas carbonis]
MMADAGDCGSCGHAWALHPLATRIRVCAGCVAEEDHNERSAEDVCARVPPELGLRQAADVLAARDEDPVGSLTLPELVGLGEDGRS